ncbi:MAG: alpha/beta hydrolase [Pseudomonadota bacterium]
MIGWFLSLLILGLVAFPWVMEAARRPMTAKEREKAPGQFAHLSQGITHYQWTGPKDGPVVVCIHGLTTPSFVWQSTAKHLAGLGYRVLAYDLFGRGYSDRPSGRQTPAFFIRQLNELLDDQQVGGDLTVIGYSMGGAITAEFAASRSDDIRRVVLLAPAGMGIVASGWLRSLVRTPILGGWFMLLFYPRLLKKGLEAEKDLPGTVPGINAMQRAELTYRGFLPAVHASMRGMLSGDLQKAHGTLHRQGIPVLAMWGECDDVIPLTAKDRLAAWNPKSVHHVIDGAGHGLTYTHTSDVMKHIEAFLEKSA